MGRRKEEVSGVLLLNEDSLSEVWSLCVSLMYKTCIVERALVSFSQTDLKLLNSEVGI